MSVFLEVTHSPYSDSFWLRNGYRIFMDHNRKYAVLEDGGIVE